MKIFKGSHRRFLWKRPKLKFIQREKWFLLLKEYDYLKRNTPLFLARKYENIEFNYLNGNYQQQNKDIALTTIDTLQKYYPIKLNQKKINDGIKNQASWPSFAILGASPM